MFNQQINPSIDKVRLGNSWMSRALELPYQTAFCAKEGKGEAGFTRACLMAFPGETPTNIIFSRQAPTADQWHCSKSSFVSQWIYWVPHRRTDDSMTTASLRGFLQQEWRLPAPESCSPIGPGQPADKVVSQSLCSLAVNPVTSGASSLWVCRLPEPYFHFLAEY